MSINSQLLNLQFPEHIPVLLNPILEAFDPILKGPRSSSEILYFDGTFGRGGHYRALKTLNPNLQACVFDQDPQAIAYAHEHFKAEVESGQLKVEHANFSAFSPEKWGHFDIMLLDLGVSSPQLDEAERGFSFYHDGPLDMRMNTSSGVTAEMIINEWDENDLIQVFKEYGEVRSPYRVVRAVVHDRKTKPFKTTQQLAGLIERVEGWRKKGFHPATLYFQGLRLAVNQELEVLQQALPRVLEGLRPGGRLAVITFHSLEDRIVKNVLKSSSLGRPVNKKVIVAEREEQMKNPRSRSAKLRVFERDA
ncbi:MAG: 16S rRNA (cytosine(1402)-N(4))-methyltransferase RsmH [Bdellovibrionales bacterium]